MSEPFTSREGQPISLVVATSVPGGRGFALFEGRPVFVVGGVPGDEVEVRITRDHSAYMEAELVRIISAGEHRRPDDQICPHALSLECGGCDWAAVRTGSERFLKTQMLLDALRRVGKLAPEEIPEVRFFDSPPAYRLRTRLHLDGLGRLGFYAPGSHDVCDIASCEVLSPSLFRRVEELRERLSGFRDISGAEIQLLEDLQGENSGVAIQVPAGPEAPVIAAAVSGVAQSMEISSASGKRLLGNGPKRIPIRVGGALFLVSPRAFFQANRFLLEPFLEEVRQPIRRLAAEHGSTWGLDLYAGAGFLTRALAEALPRTVAVEPDAVSLSDLRANAAAWEPELKSRITVHAGTAESFLAKFKGRGGAVIVDPPRAGVSPEVRRALLHLGPDLLVYVSCDPATLARDLRDLKKSFRIRSLAILNLFPATHHMETVAVLEPAALSERLPQPRSAD